MPEVSPVVRPFALFTVFHRTEQPSREIVARSCKKLNYYRGASCEYSSGDPLASPPKPFFPPSFVPATERPLFLNNCRRRSAPMLGKSGAIYHLCISPRLSCCFVPLDRARPPRRIRCIELLPRYRCTCNLWTFPAHGPRTFTSVAACALHHSGLLHRSKMHERGPRVCCTLRGGDRNPRHLRWIFIRNF